MKALFSVSFISLCFQLVGQHVLFKQTNSQIALESNSIQKITFFGVQQTVYFYSGTTLELNAQSFEFTGIDSFFVNIETTYNPCSSLENIVLGGITNGGVGPFTYSWSTGSTNEIIFINSAGVYTVTITDANNWVASDTIEIFDSAILNTNPIIQHVSEFGLSDGSIDLNVSGGTEPYTILWSNGISSPLIGDLSPGQYSYTITDANGCQLNGLIQIIEPSETNAINESNNFVDWKIYPNPTHDEISIQFNNFAAKKTTITLLSLDGRILFTKDIEPNTNDQSYYIDAMHLSPGAYFVTLTLENGTTMAKTILKL